MRPILRCLGLSFCLAAACTPVGSLPTDPDPTGTDTPPAVPQATHVGEKEPTQPTPGPYVVDPTTMTAKVMFGYQGWFACPGDGAPPDRWVHWFRNQTPDAANATVDLWPDVSELAADELCETDMTLPGGGTAAVYSSYHPATVDRHFEWMADHDLDGVFLQRFSSELGDPAFFALRNQIANNARFGAEAHERVFAMMYDISGQNPATLVQTIQDDWMYLVDTLEITGSPRYLQHDGRPVLGLWGLGFNDRPGTPAEAAQLIDWFTTSAPAKYRVTLLGGVPTYWRTLNNDSKSDPAWASVYRSFDVISPWAVGRYADEAGADAFRSNLIEPDLAAADAAGAEYMPVVFPGFSWFNLNGGALNQIPRNGGQFYWRQAFNAVDAGASMIYVAMFDEVDEGTAMFKVAPTAAQAPAQGSWLTLDADGVTLPSDWYLQLGDETGKMLRGDTSVSEDMPISPP